MEEGIMKRIVLLRALLIALALFFSAEVVWSQIPKTLSYQGVLSGAKGEVVPDGLYSITFRLYTVDNGGAPIWSETQSIEVKGGLFNAALGRTNSLDIPFDQPYWLAISVGDGSEASQRMKLTSSAYSLQARTVVDSAITSSKIASGQVVKSINSITDDIRLVPGENVAIRQDGNSLVISARSGQTGVGQSTAAIRSSKGDVLTALSGPPTPQPFWTIMGNNSTMPDINFIGTTDAADWVVKTNNSERIRVTSGGDVGIGTEDPAAKLHVVGNAKVDNTLFITNVSSNSPLRLQTAGKTRMFISDVNGHVGIGTEIPAAKLDVANDGTAPAASFANTNAANNSAALEARTNGNGNAVEARNEGHGKAASFANTNAANNSAAMRWRPAMRATGRRHRLRTPTQQTTVQHWKCPPLVAVQPRSSMVRWVSGRRVPASSSR
jgi:hypothetical protein